MAVLGVMSGEQVHEVAWRIDLFPTCWLSFCPIDSVLIDQKLKVFLCYIIYLRPEQDTTYDPVLQK